MNAASITEIKRELKELDEEALVAHVLRLARFKKDNKELLTYLLFEEKDEASYIQMICEEIEDSFEEVNQHHIYYAKKGIRKILRNVTKYIRYSGKKQTEIEILIAFCRTMRDSGINFKRSTVLNNLYLNQLKKINKALLALHEDLRYDYEEAVSELTGPQS